MDDVVSLFPRLQIDIAKEARFVAAFAIRNAGIAIFADFVQRPLINLSVSNKPP